MNILLAPDKFKGSLSAPQVCAAMSKGIHRFDPSIQCLPHPMADGGDGSLDILASFLPTKKITIDTIDPLGSALKASYLIYENKAYIELATASGIVLLSQDKRNPLKTSTLGTGMQIKDALSRGIKRIFLFAGGSATNDGAIGIAQALGFSFYDHHKNILQPIGENLIRIAHIVQPESLPDFQLYILTDVNNPLCGSHGAAHTYAKQKGADEHAILLLEKGMIHFAKNIKRQFGRSVAAIPGGGCAGGVGAGGVGLLDATLKNGFQMLSEITQLESKVEAADLIITGEGKLDAQTLQGKVVAGIAKLCKKYHKPLVAFTGKNTLTKTARQELGLQKAFAILDKATNQQDGMDRAAYYLEEMAFEMMRNWGDDPGFKIGN